MSPDAALSPRRATCLFLLRQNKVSQKKSTLVPASLRYGQPAVLASSGVELELAALKQSLALIRLKLRFSAHSQGFWERGRIEKLGRLLLPTDQMHRSKQKNVVVIPLPIRFLDPSDYPRQPISICRHL